MGFASVFNPYSTPNLLARFILRIIIKKTGEQTEYKLVQQSFGRALEEDNPKNKNYDMKIREMI